MQSMHDYAFGDGMPPIAIAAHGVAYILVIALVESAAMMGAAALTIAWAVPSVLWSLVRRL